MRMSLRTLPLHSELIPRTMFSLVGAPTYFTGGHPVRMCHTEEN